MFKTEHVLVVGPAWVGDMVMAHTLFQLLAVHRPGAKLTVMVPPWCRPLLERMPEVSESIPIPLKHGELALRKRYQLGKALRTRHYRDAIVLPNSFKSALIPFFASIPKRTGWLGECRVGVLNDWRKLNKARYPLMIERFAALAFPPGATLPPTLPRPKLIVQSRAQVIHKFKLNLSTPILILCPGAEFGPAKMWPASHYAVLAKAKLQIGWQVWLLGSQKDRAQTETIQHLTQQGCLDLAGQTSLGEAVDILSLANVVVSNDSGLMHIAAALNRPLVALYGSTTPSFTPPLADSVKILTLKLPCSPCFKRQCPLKHLNCLNALSPLEVIAAIDELQLVI